MRKDALYQFVDDLLFARTLIILADISTCAFDEMAVLHARWARCFASAATQTQIQMLDQVWRQFAAPFGHGAHQINTPTWRISFASQFGISWALRQAKPAMNAVHQAVVIEMGMNL